MLHRGGLSGLAGLAGWLFADLMLGIGMLFLISSTTATGPLVIKTPTPLLTVTLVAHGTVLPVESLTATFTPSPTPTATLTPTATATPTPTLMPTAEPPTALRDASTSITITVDAPGLLAGYPDAQQALLNTLRRQENLGDWKDSRAGMVLTFGGTTDASYGSMVAEKVNALLPQVFPDRPRLFKDARMKNYLDYQVSVGTVVFEIWFYTR